MQTKFTPRINQIRESLKAIEKDSDQAVNLTAELEDLEIKESLLQQTKFTSIGDVAIALIKIGVSFNYDVKTLTIFRASDFDLFKFVSYHVENNNIIFMDGDYNNVPEKIVAKEILKRINQ